jgi:hypothetical protein
MTDPEVARLRRLRSEALRIREVARALGSTQWADDSLARDLLGRGACAGWRIARVVSGKLNAHPYLRYQRGLGLGSIVANHLSASFLAVSARNRVQALRRFESQLQVLVRHLDDTRALSWSSDFSDTLGRSQHEVQSLLEDLAQVTETGVPTGLPKRATRTDDLGGLAQSVEGDWPYLAF